MNKALRDIYDSFAETYDSNRDVFDITNILDRFYSQLQTGQGNLLDLGCGAGEPVARYFIDHNWNVTGIDFSGRMLELASRYVPEMEAIKVDINNAKFESSRFNAITATYSLFHVPAALHTKLFERIFQWLRPEGKFLFTYATREYTGAEEFNGYKTFMNEELYYSHKSPDQLYKDLEEIGFIIESTEYRDIGNEIFLWVTARRPVT